jgi:hypothetical protein
MTEGTQVGFRSSLFTASGWCLLLETMGTMNMGQAQGDDVIPLLFPGFYRMIDLFFGAPDIPRGPDVLTVGVPSCGHDHH